MINDKGFTCTDSAWEYGVRLEGTATRGDIWFLIEYPDRWDAKAFENSKIDLEVKAHIKAVSDQQPFVRTLLIRQPRSRKHNRLQFFIAQTSAQEPRLYGYELKNYRDILDIDLMSLASGLPGDPNYLRLGPLFLVCTNGRRDKCCSIYGPEVYQAITKKVGENAWQSSHIGGHNQAPITLFFPYGVNYCHTTPSEAMRLVQAYQQNKIVLHHYRGRVCYETHVQAAEHFWREQTGVLELPGMRVDSVTQLGADQWNVTISDVNRGMMEEVRVERRQSDYEIPITCTGEKLEPVSSFHRIG
jgi:hypothetical protein